MASNNLTIYLLLMAMNGVQVFNIRYPEMHKGQGAKCAISKLIYGLFGCTDDNHLLKLVAYHLVHTDKPYINLHLLHLSSVQH